jgi:hypothetical protein
MAERRADTAEPRIKSENMLGRTLCLGHPSRRRAVGRCVTLTHNFFKTTLLQDNSSSRSIPRLVKKWTCTRYRRFDTTTRSTATQVSDDRPCFSHRRDSNQTQIAHCNATSALLDCINELNHPPGGCVRRMGSRHANRIASHLSTLGLCKRQ